MIRLVCPMCQSTVVEAADDVLPGVCPGCGAEFAGDAQTPGDAVRAAVDRWGLDNDVDTLTAELFSADAVGEETSLAIASDERDGFYRWWVFRR